MHPAISVVLFTVLSGAGYGFVALFVAVDALGLGAATGLRELVAAAVIGAVLITVGLLFSVGHLARPGRAWRSFARFRTSWLSREAVLAVAFYPVAALYLAAYALSGLEHNAATLILGTLTALLAVATVVATGMIYACVQAIREWRQALTPVNYLLIGLALGGALLTAFLAATGAETRSAALITMVLLVAAGIAKTAWYAGNGRTGLSSKATALGLGATGPVRLVDRGHSGGNFLTREFQYPLSAGVAQGLRAFALVATFLVPLLPLGVVLLGGAPVWAYVALGVALAGALVERWLVFAEARHAVRLFYDTARL